MLENAGAEVTAIESNTHAFLRCLVVKNIFALKSNFIFGDFTKSFCYPGRWDLVIASGVLYHMTDPTALIKRAAAVTDCLFFWTHYFEPDLNKWNWKIRPQIGTKWRPDLLKTLSVEDIDVRIVPQTYGEALGWSGFCGGADSFSYWIYREDIILLLESLGFNSIEIAFDMPTHQNGPAFCILARR